MSNRTSFDARSTLDEIVAACPEAAPLLADRNLDTCCGGGQPLADACAKAGVPVEDVLYDLERARTAA